MARSQTVLVDEIRIGKRHRKDLGDLGPLAASIEAEGLLQPIGITQDKELVFGERRLRAVCDVLGWDRIEAKVVNVSSIAAGEYAENQIRKGFTTSERVAIGRTIEDEIGNRQGKRTDLKEAELVDAHPQVDSGEKTRAVAAKCAGFESDFTYRQAAKVVNDGAAEIVLQAERRLGEMLAHAPKHPAGRPPVNRSHNATNLPPSLADLGITKSQSSRWQLAAKVGEESRCEAQNTIPGLLPNKQRARGTFPAPESTYGGEHNPENPTLRAFHKARNGGGYHSASLRGTSYANFTPIHTELVYLEERQVRPRGAPGRFSHWPTRMGR